MNKNDVVKLSRLGTLKIKKYYFLYNRISGRWIIVNKIGKEIIEMIWRQFHPNKIINIISEKFRWEKNKTKRLINSFMIHIDKNKFFLKNEIDLEKIIKKKRRMKKEINFEITRRCNLNCKHCSRPFTNSVDSELSFEEISYFLHDLKRFNTWSHLRINGGEPLMREDFVEILNMIEKLKFTYSIFTNGTLINKRLVSYFKSLKYLTEIQISLDGSTEKTNDLIRGKGIFEKTVRGLDYLFLGGLKHKVSLSFTPNKLNLPEVPDIIKLTLKMGIKKINFSWLQKAGNAIQSWKLLCLNFNQKKWLTNYLYEKSVRLKDKIEMTRVNCHEINLKKETLFNYLCDIGITPTITYDGWVYPCSMYYDIEYFKIGNIRKNNLQEIMNGERFKNIKKEFIQRYLKIEKCKGCSWVGICFCGCAVLAYLEKGTIYSNYECRLWKLHFKKKVKEICDVL